MAFLKEIDDMRNKPIKVDETKAIYDDEIEGSHMTSAFMIAAYVENVRKAFIILFLVLFAEFMLL
jgi:hypothetical protein